MVLTVGITIWVSQSTILFDQACQVVCYCYLSMGIACCQVLISAQAARVGHARPSSRLDELPAISNHNTQPYKEHNQE